MVSGVKKSDTRRVWDWGGRWVNRLVVNRLRWVDIVCHFGGAGACTDLIGLAQGRPTGCECHFSHRLDGLGGMTRFGVGSASCAYHLVRPYNVSLRSYLRLFDKIHYAGVQ